MGKYTQKLVEKISSLIEEDNYTITEICRIVGISRNVFYEWRTTKPEFSESLDRAFDAREERLRQQARKSMRQKLEGQKQIETKITYTASKDSDDPHTLVVKEYVVKEKYCLPETSAIIHSLSGGYNEAKSGKQPISRSPLVIQVDNEKTKCDMERLQQRLSS